MSDPLLDLAHRLGLVDDELAASVAEEAARTGREPSAILEARGLFTAYISGRLQEAVSAPAPEIPGFRITGRLGHGGMGTVYRAVQASVGREVALKVVVGDRARDRVFVERFLREARAAAAVNHLNVVTVHDAGRAGECLYLAMELVPGGDVDRLAKACGGSLPPRRAAQIVRDAARGLGALARAGLIHRDLKPANLFINEDGVAKVADLGLARGSGDRREHLTVDGSVLGTPAFMSPEQARGDADLDIRSDIYALGAILYALLTGQPPYRGNSPFAITAQVIGGPFPDPRRLDAAVPDALAEIVLRAAALERGDRFPDPAALERALDGLLPQLPAETPPTSATATRPASLPATAPTVIIGPGPAAPRRLPMALAAVAGLAVAAGLVALGMHLGRQEAAPSPAPPTPSPAPPSVPAPAWASEAGRDAHGRWADLTVFGVRQRFRWIPAGSFTMGSPPGEVGRRDDEAAHQVAITRPFWIADSEVAQALWFAVRHANPSRFPKDQQNPVDRVYHKDALAFCAELEALMPGLGVRLPTEAEWEYACRAGTAGPAPGDLLAMAWCNRPYEGNTTRPVRSGRPNPWGIYDMLGNAAEWVQDAYAPYPAGSATDPVATEGRFPVYRGGAFCSAMTEVRAAARGHDTEDGYLALGTVRLVIPDRTAGR